MEWAIALLVVAVLGVAAAIAAGGVGQMSSQPDQDRYRQDLPDTALTANDLQTLRFGITLRGYAMDQVDDLLARLSHEIAERDAVIAELAGVTDDRTIVEYQGVSVEQGVPVEQGVSVEQGDDRKVAEVSGTELGDDRARTAGTTTPTGAGEVTR